MAISVSKLVGTILRWSTGRDPRTPGSAQKRASDYRRIGADVAEIRTWTDTQHLNGAVPRVDLIMLTKRQAQRWVVKAAEPEGLEAYRVLFLRNEPISTVTAVSKLVELLATTFGGDLVDAVTDF